jgi:hypothetical protein
MKQDRQCAYNVTIRRVRESLLVWKSNKYYIFVCVCPRARGSGRMHACVCVCVCMGGLHGKRACACARVCTSMYVIRAVIQEERIMDSKSSRTGKL